MTLISGLKKSQRDVTSAVDTQKEFGGLSSEKAKKKPISLKEAFDLNFTVLEH